MTTSSLFASAAFIDTVTGTFFATTSNHSRHNDDYVKDKNLRIQTILVMLIGYHLLIRSSTGYSSTTNTVLPPPPAILLDLVGIDLKECIKGDSIQQKRVPVKEIFALLGPYYVRQAYRMDIKDFYTLHKILFPFMSYNQYRTARIVRPDGTIAFKQQRVGARNGRISSTAMLSCY